MGYKQKIKKERKAIKKEKENKRTEEAINNECVRVKFVVNGETVDLSLLEAVREGYITDYNIV